MLIIFIALKKASKKKRIYFLYTNSQDQHCFLLLAVFIANYEKQVTLIGIKSSYKYLTYYIYINKRHNLITAI